MPKISRPTISFDDDKQMLQYSINGDTSSLQIHTETTEPQVDRIPRGAKQLYDSLEWKEKITKIKNHAITSINFSHYPIDDKCAREIIEALTHDWHLTYINLDNTNIDPKLKAKINELLKRNRSIDPLYSAIEKGDLDTIKALDAKGENINVTFQDLSPPIYLAAYGGHIDIIDFLLQKGASVDQPRYDKVTPLLVAASEGNLATIKFLLQKGANINTVSEDGWTVLLAAASRNKVECLKFFLNDSRVPVNATVKGGATALLIAANEGFTEVVKTLVADDRTDLNAAHLLSGITPLYAAASKGHTNVVQALLLNNRSNTNSKLNLNTRSNDRKTALSIAAQHNHLDIIKMLLAEPDIFVNAADFDGYTALTFAVACGHIKIVEALLSDPRTNVNYKTKYGKTPLHIAAQQGFTDIIKVLLAHPKIEANAIDINGDSALSVAAQDGQVDSVNELLSSPQILVNNSNPHGYTALHMAAQENHVNVVKALIEDYQINVNAENEDGYTPLHIASQRGHTEIVKTLLTDHRININAIDKKKCTSLHVAMIGKKSEVVETLLLDKYINVNIKNASNVSPLITAILTGEIGLAKSLVSHDNINVNLINEDDMSALHAAAEAGDVMLVHSLLNKGSLVNVMDKFGRTPLYIAAEKGQLEVVKLLLDHDANLNIEDFKGVSPLTIAAKNGHIELVSYVILNQCKNLKELARGSKPDSYFVLETLYKELLRKKPYNKEIISLFSNYFLIQGNKYESQHDKRSAFAVYNFAIELYPKNVEAYIQRGLVNEKMRDFSNAISDYEAAIKMNPDNQLVLNYRENAKQRLHDSEWEWKKLLDAVSKNDSEVTKVDVTNLKIDDKHIKQLSDMLRKNNTVTRLSLQGNLMTNDGIKSLCEALSHNSSITELNLLNVNLTDDIVREISKLISQTNTLTRLNLDNSLTDAAANHFLSLFKPKRFDISAEAVRALSHALSDNQSITKLNLKNSGISLNTIKLLEPVFNNNYTLQKIDCDDDLLQRFEFPQLLNRNQHLSKLVTAIKEKDEALVDKLVDDNIVGIETLLWAIKIAYDQNDHMLIKHLINREVPLDYAYTGIEPVTMIIKNGKFDPENGDYERQNKNVDTKVISTSTFEYKKIVQQEKYLEMTDELKAIISRLYAYHQQAYQFNKQDASIYIDPDVGCTQSSKQRYPLSKQMNDFLCDSEKLSLLILGEAGLGKTLFSERLEKEYWEKWQASKIKQSDCMIPIRIPLSSVDHNSTHLLEEFLSKKGFLNQEIELLKKACQEQHCRLLLILDGFDETIPHPTNSLYDANKWIEEWGSPKVVTFSRPEAFRNNPYYQNLFYPAAGMANTFQELYLRTFTPNQIQTYLDSQNQHPEYKYLYTIHPLSILAKNPLILSILTKILPCIGYDLELAYNQKPTEIKPKKIYLYLEDDEIHLIAKDHQGVINEINFNNNAINPLFDEVEIENIKNILKDPLAAAHLSDTNKTILIDYLSSKGYPPKLTTVKSPIKYIPYTREQIFGQFVDQWLEEQTIRRICSDKTKLDIIARFYKSSIDLKDPNNTFLTDFKECLMIYLENLAKQAWNKSNGQLDVVFSEEDTLRPELLTVDKDRNTCFKNPLNAEKMRPFLEILRSACLLTNHGHHWQFLNKSILEYFACREVFHGVQVEACDYVKGIYNFPVDFTFNDHLLLKEPNLINMLADLAQTDSNFKAMLYRIINLSVYNASVSNAAANAITILKVSGEVFSKDNIWKGVRIKGADLSEAICEADFSDADLTEVNFENAWLRDVNFQGAILQATRFIQATTGCKPDVSAMLHSKGQKIIFMPSTQKFYFLNSDDHDFSLQLLQNKLSRRSDQPAVESKYPEKFYPLSLESLESDNKVTYSTNQFPEIKVSLERVFTSAKLPQWQGYAWIVNEVNGRDINNMITKYPKDCAQFIRAISPNKKYLIVGATYNKNHFLYNNLETQINVKDLSTTGTHELILYQHIEPIRFLQFSADDEYLLTVNDKQFRVDNFMNIGDYDYSLNLPADDKISAVAVNDSKMLVAAISMTGVLCIWDREKHTCLYNDKIPCKQGSDNNAVFSDMSFFTKDTKDFLQCRDEDNNEFTFEIVDNTNNIDLKLVNRTGSLELNCKGANFTNAINCSVSKAGFFKSKGAIGEPIHLSAKEVDSIKKNINSFKYVSNSTSSMFDRNLVITPVDWTVSLLRDPEHFSDVQHTFIIIEGMNEWNEMIFYRFDLTTNPKMPGIGQIESSEKGPTHIRNHRDMLDRIVVLHPSSNQRRDYEHLLGHTFEISRDKALRLYWSIKHEEGKQIPYHECGKGSFLSWGKHNCFTWAREKLLALDVKKINERLKDSIFDVFFSRPACKLRATPDKDNENDVVVISRSMANN